mgnify:CR=1 FL=1
MKYKKNRFIIFYVFNIILLFVVLLLAVPASKLLKKIKKELELGILMYSRTKTYAQATGWIGVLIGLVIMLKNGDFTDIAQWGPAGLAICILTVFYGTIIAYLICLPIQTKLERHLSLLQES